MNDCTSQDFAVMKFRFMAKLAVFMIGLSFLYFFCVTFISIPDGNVGNTNTVVGFIILEIGIVIGYYFGSSQSSRAMKEKDEGATPDQNPK
jgi:uncharacterized membrane protein